MSSFRNISIKNKLLVVYIVITAVVLASAFAIIMRIDIKNSKENVLAGLEVVGEIIADRCAASLAFSDVESANSHLRALRSHESVVYACIRTNENHEFAEYTSNVENLYKCDDYKEKDQSIISDDHIDVYKPILLEGEPIGSVQIKATLNALNQQVLESAKISVLIFVGLMLIAAAVSRKLMTMLTGPITRLKDIAQIVTDEKNYDLRAEKVADDEVGVLVTSFNKMLDQISVRDKALIEEKEKAEISASTAKKYAKETESINIDLENEIRERARIEEELQNLNETLEEKVQERTAELKELNDKIGDIARSAGMAEVASGVLHNVGNVLNSVNVSASVIREQIRRSKSENLNRLVMMLEKNRDNIADFISRDEKGKQIPRFLMLLAEQLKGEKNSVYRELDELANNIDHIKNVISMQQSYAGSYGVREKVKLSDLVEDALKINVQGMLRHNIKIEKEYRDVPLIYIDKHKALQVIINLISNAKHALIDAEGQDNTLTIFVGKEAGSAVVEVRDTGVGIENEDLKHLFEYGFKKRKDGHGYGLHHSALVANELGGQIKVHSDGPGKGASFKLYVPIDEQAAA